MANEYYYMMQYQKFMERLQDANNRLTEHTSQENKKLDASYAARRKKILDNLEKLNKYADKGNTANEVIIDKVKMELDYLDRDFDLAASAAAAETMKIVKARLEIEESEKANLNQKVPSNVVNMFINDNLKAKLN